MAQSFRQPEILDLARATGQVTVEGLAAHFGVTLQTIRRDLADMAEAGQLERVHGGAILPSGTRNIRYEERRRLNQSAKAAIAGHCAAMLPEGASIFLNIGTTTEAVARALRQHRGIMVVTNNMNVAHILAENPECEVVLAGGRLRRADGGLTGSLTRDTIRQFHFDHAVIGCSALDVRGDILDFDLQEVEVTRTIIERTRHVILAADHTKFQRKAPVRIGSLADVDSFVTDVAPPSAVLEAAQNWKTRLILCDEGMFDD